MAETLAFTQQCAVRVAKFCAAVAALAVLLAAPVQAVRTDAIYAAEVDLPGGANGMQQAFNAALEEVLVKVTGLETLGNNAARRSLVPDSSRLVRQYSRLADNRLRVEFDGVELGRILDAAGQPVWGIERPLVAVWYAIDDGAGNRSVLTGGSSDGPLAARGRDEELRASLQEAAARRGLPVVFPLVDAEDLRRVSFSDIWGNFSGPVMDASQRYAADAVLIGRAQTAATNARRVRWTLVTRQEQFSWQGPALDGPGQAAAWLSQRLATYADASGALRVVIGNIDSFDKFGQLQKYLRTLNVVEDAQVVGVQGERVELELVVRGDAARLGRTFDSGRYLERDAQSGGSVSPGARMPDLVYNWAGGR